MTKFKRTQHKYVKKSYRVGNWREYDRSGLLSSRGIHHLLWIRLASAIAAA